MFDKVAVENQISQLKSKIQGEQSELSQRRKRLQKYKDDTETAEQEMAILLHKKDACREIRARVHKEQTYFDELILRNRQKLAVLKAEDSFLNQFEKLLAYMDEKEQVCTIKPPPRGAQGTRETQMNPKIGLLPTHSVLDDPKVLAHVCKRGVTLFKKMQLKISNLSDLFKEYQNLIKQKQRKHESISQNLREKEALLAKLVQPSNDFGTIMKSFIEESDNKNASRCRTLSLGPTKSPGERSQVLSAFQATDEDYGSCVLHALQSQNRRLLGLVRGRVTEV